MVRYRGYLLRRVIEGRLEFARTVQKTQHFDAVSNAPVEDEIGRETGAYAENLDAAKLEVRRFAGPSHFWRSGDESQRPVQFREERQTKIEIGVGDEIFGDVVNVAIRLRPDHIPWSHRFRIGREGFAASRRRFSRQ